MIIHFTFLNEENKHFGLLISHCSSPDIFIGTIIDSSFSICREPFYENTLKKLIYKVFKSIGGVSKLTLQTQPLIGDADFKTELMEILELLKK